MIKYARIFRSGMTRQLLVWFLIMAFTPLTVVTFIVYRQSERMLRQSFIRDLETVANRQSHQIVTFVRGLEKDVATLARVPVIVQAMQRLDRVVMDGGMFSNAYWAVDRSVRPFLSYFKESFGYDDLFLISIHGDILFSVRQGEDLGSNLKTGIYRNTELALVFDRANTLMETAISDFEFYPVSNEPASFIASPIIDDRQIIGVVAFQMNNDQIYEIVNDYTGLGDSGETVVASVQQNKAVFQTPTRHDPYAAFRRKVSLNSGNTKGIAGAVLGRKNAGIINDYRGESTLAVWKYIPDLRWGMVTKIDTREAFAPVIKLRLLYGITTVFTLVLVFASAAFVAGGIAKPLRLLKKSTHVIAKGYFKHKIKVSAGNEIGDLADSFNEMTQKLQHSIQQLTRTTAEKERIESELAIAHEIQMGILPKAVPPFPGRGELDAYARLIPAREVGGDFFAYFFIDERHLCFSVGDVSGKGVPAAILMAVTYTLIKAQARPGLRPNEILNGVNHEVCDKAQNNMFVTAFLGILDVRTGRVQYSNAGHNPPLVLRKNGQMPDLRNQRTLVLGVFKDFEYETSTVELGKDEGLFLYTDGVTEAMDPAENQFENNGFYSVLRQNSRASGRLLAGRMITAVREFSAGVPQFDDLTVMVLRWLGPSKKTYSEEVQ